LDLSAIDRVDGEEVRCVDDGGGSRWREGVRAAGLVGLEKLGDEGDIIIEGKEDEVGEVNPVLHP
jgi:hypothetical protein